MTVYYIGHPNGAIKIGYAANLINRHLSLERQYRTRLELLTFEDGTAEMERVRHDQFAGARLNQHQEWFRPVPELLDWLVALCTDPLDDWPAVDKAMTRVEPELLRA